MPTRRRARRQDPPTAPADAPEEATAPPRRHSASNGSNGSNRSADHGGDARSSAGSSAGSRGGSRGGGHAASAVRPGRFLLLRAAHPRQALVTAAALAGAAALAARPAREVALVAGTALVGQVLLGWHNDLVDRTRDADAGRPGKPVADGRLDPGTVWFALVCAALLVVPLSLTNGLTAGSAYLLALAIGLLGNVALRRSWLSWLPWAASYALYPAFLSYGGWGGDALGDPPEVSITVLAALLGVCVHVLRALPGLVVDNRQGMRHLPLRIALRIGAPRLLWISIALTALVVVALFLEAARVGLSQ
jgi:4-hydroxybenzoate polyprenyltransferase